MNTNQINNQIEENRFYTRTYRYKIRNDFSISSYSDKEILEVLKSDFEEYERGLFILENNILTFLNNKYIDRVFKENGLELLSDQLNAKLYAYDSGYFKILENNGNRLILYKLNNKSLKTYSIIGLSILSILFIINTIYWSDTLLGFLFNTLLTVIPMGFLYGLIELIHFMKTKSMVNEIIMREENKINNEL